MEYEGYVRDVYFACQKHDVKVICPSSREVGVPIRC